MRGIVLEDGTRIPIRAITTTDAVPLQMFHRGLTAKTRYMRFFGHYPELNPELAHYFSNVDGTDRLALVAVDPVVPQTIIGVVRLDRDGSSNTAEYAAVVTDAWQGIGIGHELTLAILADVEKVGIKKIFAFVQPGNQPMLALLKGLHHPWSARFEDGVERIEVNLTQPWNVPSSIR